MWLDRFDLVIGDSFFVCGGGLDLAYLGEIDFALVILL